MKRPRPSQIILAMTGIACAGVLLAPVLESRLLYALFSMLCHQIPERSWNLAGEPLAVCIRCSSIYAGFFIALLIGVRPSVSILRVAIGLSLLEVVVAQSAIDFAIARALSGLLLGSAVAGFVAQGVGEMVEKRFAPPHAFMAQSGIRERR